jgi:MATE family multidrug resistance protein
MSETEHSNEYSPLLELPHSYSGTADEEERISAQRETVEEPTKAKLFNMYHEMESLVNIALPTVLVQFSTFFLYPQCASAVGRNFDTESLAAFSLGSLSGNMTCISIIIGTLSACETLQPRAFGLEQYGEVGLLAIRGLFMCVLSLLVPVIILLARAETIFDNLGQDADASVLAADWIKIYIWSVPPLLLFRVTQRFLACQNIVIPCLFGGAIGCFLVHPFVLKWAIEQFGFLGSSYAVVITQTVQFSLCIGFLSLTGFYDKRTWPGISMATFAKALDIRELMTYSKLSIAGILSLSEWWFWEFICFMAGKFGIVELCIHSVSYQIVPIAFMIPLGISIGLNVRLGVLLPVNVNGAKRLAAFAMVITIIIGIAVSTLIYKKQAWIVAMFTTDEEVFQGCQKIWTKLCIYNVLLWAFCISRGILSALGLQWRTAATMFMILWCGTMPAIIKFCVHNDNGFYLMWHMLPWVYAVLNVGLMMCYMTADWEKIGADIRLNARDL